MKLCIPEHIKNLIPYPPGKPIEELEREYGITGSIKMASNENSLGPSPKAVKAIADSLTNLHRYPDGSCYYLAQNLAAKLKVSTEQLVFGNGSDEIIAMLGAAFVQSGDEVITSHPSFLVYPKVTQAQGGINVVVPLKNMAHDLDAILEKVTDRTRLIFLDNPNNPTGTFFGEAAFTDFLEQIPEHVVVVLDEAYIDFVEDDLKIDARKFLAHSTPVVALRTFSKAYGLAGLRVGYGIMPPEIANCLHRVRGPFNVNIPAQVGAIAALDDDDHYQKTMSMTKDGISWLSAELLKLGVHPFPTHTNFFLVDLKRDGKEFYQKMLQKGVIVRPMTAYGYPKYIRITVGTMEENKRLLKAFTKSLKKPETRLHMPDKTNIITIDGPSGSGKSTISRMLADKLRYTYLDTGAMYRAVGLQAVRKKTDLNQPGQVQDLLSQIDIQLMPGEVDTTVILNGEDVSHAIRTAEMGMMASKVSALGQVREKLTAIQQELGEKGAIVAEGRDMGTVVFPMAKHKFYLIATAEERANRRTEQLHEKGQQADHHTILQQIIKRDHDDSTRALAPLKPAADAIELDSTEITIEQVVQFMMDIIASGN